MFAKIYNLEYEIKKFWRNESKRVDFELNKMIMIGHSEIYYIIISVFHIG